MLASGSCIGKIYEIYSSLLMQVSLFSKKLSTSSCMGCSVQIDLDPSSSHLIYFSQLTYYIKMAKTMSTSNFA
jgi:hypothetical protein